MRQRGLQLVGRASSDQVQRGLVQSGFIKVGEADICTCCNLADLTRVQTFRPAEGFCTCFDRMLHGTCCHLLAARELEAFQGMELPFSRPPVSR